jgi:ribose transport system ATP-binding protein
VVVLLLVVPTRGIDVGSKEQIYALVDELVAGRRGAPRAVVLVSSDFGELLGVSDRVAVMCRGRLGPARPVAELDEGRLVAEAAGAA